MRSTGVRDRYGVVGGIAAAGALLASLLAPLPAAADHEEHELQVTAELDRNLGGTKHRLRAKLDPAAGEGGVQVDFEITSGPNDDDDDALIAPDMTCTVPEGATACRVSYQGKKASGTDRILAWIDHDGDNVTVDADESEKPDAGAAPDEPGCSEAACGPALTTGAGDVAEPDGTDVVLKDWGQFGAGQVAYLDGPITFQIKGCDTGKDRNRRGRVVGTAKACTLVYLVPPADDLSEERNFGSVWIQSSVDARSGWCAKTVKTILQVPDGAALEGVTPKKTLEIAKRTLDEVILRVGTTEEMTTASQMSHMMFLYPGTRELKKRDGGEIQRLIWKGRTRERLSFALGLSLSWAEADGLPDFSSSSGVLRRELVKRTTC